MVLAGLYIDGDCMFALGAHPLKGKIQMAKVTAAVLFAVAFCASASCFAQHHGHSTAEALGQPAGNEAQAAKPGRAEGAAPAMHAQAVFTLRTGVAEGRLVFLGAGGSINGQVNPMLKVHQGETVQINLVNGEGAQHDIVIDQYGARSDMVVGKGASSSLSFTANKTGEFNYYCSVPGHRAAGMEGRIQVLPGPRAPEVATAPDIVRDPTDLPRPIFTRPAQIVHVDWRLSSLSASSTTKRRTTIGPSTAKFPVPSYGCALATRSRCASRTVRIAS